MDIRLSSLILKLILILFIYSTSTFLRLQYIFYVAVLLYLVITFAALYEEHIYLYELIHSPLSIFFALISLFSILLFIHGGKDQWLSFFAGYLHVYFWTLFFVIFARIPLQKEKEIHTAINIALMVVWSLATIRAVSQFPDASRAMYGNLAMVESLGLDLNYLNRIGCGGYGFVYGLVFIIFALICQIRSGDTILLAGNTVKKTWINMILIVIFAFTIIKAAFTTALAMLFFAILLLIYFEITKESKSKILSLLIMLTVCFILYKEGLNIIFWIGETFGVDIFVEKMAKMTDAMGSSDMLQIDRFENYYLSWNAFKAHPLFGSAEAAIDSQILVQLAYMGIGALSYVGLLHSAFSVMRKYIPGFYITIIEILTMFLALFNTFTDMTSISIVFFFTPVLLLRTRPPADHTMAPKGSES